MRKISFLLFGFISIFIFTSTSVVGSSSFGLAPEDVIKEAEVIVLGQYDFSYNQQISDGSGYEFSTGTKFEVNSVYLGEAQKEIIAGYNYFDSGFEQHQSNGGEYLLFLEQKEDVDYLTPVSRTGVVPVLDGKVTESIDEQLRVVYQNFMDEQADKDSFINYDIKSLLTIGIGILIVIIFLIIFRKRKKYLKLTGALVEEAINNK